MLEHANLHGNHIPNGVLRHASNAVTAIRRRKRMLLFLGAENVRCESVAKRFLARDGDRAVVCRIWSFMLSRQGDGAATLATQRFWLP